MSEPHTLVNRARRSGIGLSDNTITWGRRPERPPAVGLTLRDLGLLERLYEVGYLSASHLYLLGWGRDLPHARRRLKTLHDAGLVDKFRPTSRVGSFEWNYRLAVAGWRTLVAHGLVSATPAYSPPELHSLAYAEHDLHVNALVIDLAVRIAGSGVPLLKRLPFTWQARSAVFSVSPHTTDAGYVHPDAVLCGHDAGGIPVNVMIEYDRTERPSTQAERLRRYDRFLVDGWRHTRFADAPEPPVVLYVAMSDRHRDGLLEVAARVLLTSAASERSHRGRDYILLTTRDRLHDADWTVHHIASDARPGAGSAYYAIADIFSRPRGAPGNASRAVSSSRP